jgi:hypothetical protein
MKKPHQTNFQRDREQNGIRGPAIDGLCHEAWRVFDRLTYYDEDKAPHLPQRRDAIAAGVARGLNKGNLGTEWSRWRRYNGFDQQQES